MTGLDQPLGRNAASLNPRSASIKTEPEDWQVVEVYDEDFSDAGEHLYLWVEKRCLGTKAVAAWLAQQFDVAELDVGFAGMKDKHALTTQWFSVRIPDADPHKCLDPPVFDGVNADEQIQVLRSHRHSRKLRRGEHQANRFRIVLRDIDGPIDASEIIKSLGQEFPNYFGPQRFGRHNLGDALKWLQLRRTSSRKRRLSRQRKGWHLSVLRSWIFNQLLSARVADGSWQRVIDGDVKSLGPMVDGLVPQGPLWGRGRELRYGESLAQQQHCLETLKTPDANQTLGEVCGALEFAGVDRGTRSLVAKPGGVSCDIDDANGTTTLGFCLPVGSYATVLLGQWFELCDRSLESLG